MKLSKLVDSMKPSPTLALNAKAKELKAAGKDVIALSVGEPDWNTMEPIQEAAIKAIREGYTKYSPSSGIPELRQAVADDLNSYLNLNYQMENVSVTSGAKFSIFAAMRCLLDPGDKVGVVSPYWVSYPTMVGLCGAQAEIIETKEENRFKLSPEDLDRALKQGLKMVLLNSPSNPTGIMYSKEDLKALGEVLEKYPETWIMTDDIYCRLTLEVERAPHLLQSCPQLQDRTVMIDGASKSYAMTGWRIGWAVGSKDLIKAMTNYQSQTVSCAATFSQMASLVALKDCQKLVRNSVADLKARKDFFASKLKGIQGLEVFEPDATFYFWVGVKSFFGKKFHGKTLNDSSEFALALLDSENLVVVPGKDFGMDGYVRMSFAVKEETLQKAIGKLESFINKLD